ncbi:FitA-like ribbon-helix-helix domain-containing protein [Pistricoccus aurantiacus]|uniref:FitA-like ribbon-helix-helix domain-containing protein n=1 Tax=Pistricoccus aurantiacus TaxID=1883414 RepID=UPI0036331730
MLALIALQSCEDIAMASITIRNLDEQLKTRLRMEAAKHGHSMEEEVRIILRNALNQPRRGGLGSRIRERFTEVGGVELEMPSRSDKPRAPGFDT